MLLHLRLKIDSEVFNLSKSTSDLCYFSSPFSIHIQTPSVISYTSHDALCLHQLLGREILFGIFITSLSLIITLTMCYGVYPCSHLEKHICHEIWDLLCTVCAHSKCFIRSLLWEVELLVRVNGGQTW